MGSRMGGELVDNRPWITARAVRIVVVLFALAALSLSTTGTALARVDALIRGSGVSWNPSHVRISPGDTVRWRAASGDHTLHAYGGNWRFSRNLSSGTSVKRTFDRTGRFKFFCSIHGSVSAGVCTGMCGRVRVT